MSTRNSSRRRRKVVKIKKNKSFWNIGTVMFGILFIYMLIYGIMYMISPRVTAYVVTEGPLSGNYRYTALALKEEEIVRSNESGKIHYYVREKSKVGVGTGIYSLGKLRLNENENSSAEAVLDEEDYSYLRSLASTFTNNFSSDSYQEVYNFKAESQTAMLELLSKQAMGDAEEGSVSGLNVVKAEKEGYILYSIDGMEHLTPEKVTSKDFIRANYKRESLRMKDSIKAKDPVYKLITSENWCMMILLDRRTANAFSEMKTVRFTFLEDNSTFNADFEILEQNDEYFGKLSISNSVARFAADRYLDIELLINRDSGLKIPISAIVERSVYKIPKDYVIFELPNEGTIGLMRETYDTDGSAITKLIHAPVYEKNDDGDYYVDVSLFRAGDYVLMKDSQKRYQISETKKVTGCYNINKGYTEFKEIEILDQNEEYCIVRSDTEYGLKQYDHIALDASVVKEDAIVVKGANQ